MSAATTALCEMIQAEIAKSLRDLGPEEFDVQPGRSEQLAVRLVIQHQINFEIAYAHGAGRVAAGYELLASRTLMEGALIQRVHEKESDIGTMVHKWVEVNTHDYRIPLPPDQCHARLLPFAVNEHCPPCGGRGQVTCHTCGGMRQTNCGPCFGTGRQRCPYCQSSRQLACNQCGGQGYNYQNQRCGYCGGNGRVTCSHCTLGDPQCVMCYGSGRVDCWTCGASGQVQCNNCAGSGIVHTVGWVTCQVQRGYTIAVAGDHAVDQAALATLAPFGQLGEITEPAGVRRIRTVVQHGILQAEYDLSVPLNTAIASLGGERLELHAYGPTLEVFDYQGLAGRLLQTDLESLEASLKRHEWFSLQGGPVIAATKRFVASEINAQIAEAAYRPLAPNAAVPAKGAAQSKRALQPDPADTRLASLVSADYMARARQALAKALPRIVLPLMVPAIVAYLAALTMMIMLFEARVLHTSDLAQFVTIGVVAGLGWFAVEVLLHGKLQRLFGPVLYLKLRRALRRSEMSYRLIPMGVVALAWFSSSTLLQLFQQWHIVR